jgi:hypothetical protein
MGFLILLENICGMNQPKELQRGRISIENALDAHYIISLSAEQQINGKRTTPSEFSQITDELISMRNIARDSIKEYLDGTGTQINS